MKNHLKFALILLTLMTLFVTGCMSRVSHSSGPSSTSQSSTNENIPTPPLTANHITDIQKLLNWSSTTGAASSCPDGVPSNTCQPPNANYNSTVIGTSDPATLIGSSGLAGLFELDSGPANATAIWGHELLTNASSTNFIWDFYLYVDGTNYSSSELDLYTTLDNGQRFMMGTQCNRATNSWDTWSEANQQWITNPSIPCNEVLTPNSWHHITFYLTADAIKDKYTYKVIRIDGTDHLLNQTQSTKNVGWPEGLIGVQVQLDANSTGTAVNEYLENSQLYAW